VTDSISFKREFVIELVLVVVALVLAVLGYVYHEIGFSIPAVVLTVLAVVRASGNYIAARSHLLIARDKRVVPNPPTLEPGWSAEIARGRWERQEPVGWALIPEAWTLFPTPGFVAMWRRWRYRHFGPRGEPKVRGYAEVRAAEGNGNSNGGVRGRR
jgi:hypothetical protein